MAKQKAYIVRQPPYSDLDLDFFKTRTTNDVSMKEAEEAIKRSVRNLVLTNFYDRPFQPDLGGNVRRLLFENVTPVTSVLLQDAISEVINNFEPRVKLDRVQVNGNPDSNGYDVTIQYIILSRQLPVVTGFFLERIR